MFCACPIVHGAEPNSAVCPVCLGHPGSLPVLNEQAVRLGVRAGTALSCAVDPQSVFARKHYFYPDLPKGYQISQFDRPLCRGGYIHVDIAGKRHRYALERIHLEEDAGKLNHEGTRSLVDWNRGGTPLIEIVGKPDIHTAEAAAEWFRMMHRVMTTAGVTQGDMQKGHFRCDANVSLATEGAPLGTRVELKNINSFRFLAKAIRHEIERQKAVLKSGERIVQSTRSWTGSESVSLRSKEDAADYRYFPEPDLGPVPVFDSDHEDAQKHLPCIPLDVWLLDQESQRLLDVQTEFALGAKDAAALLAEPTLFSLFQDSVKAGGDPQAMANWIRGPIARWKKESEGAPFLLTSEQLVLLNQRVQDGVLTRAVARELVQEICGRGGQVAEMIHSRGLARVNDAERVSQVAQDLVSKHADAAEKYRSGDSRVLGFFMGQAMRIFEGKVDGGEMQKALIKALSNEGLGD